MIAIVLLTLAFTPIAAANSAYHANLELLSTALSDNASTNRYLFAMGSVGAAPDTVYGLALCRGDVNATVCRACVVGAFWAAQQRCAYREDVTIFCPSCRLRFSGNDFLRSDDYADGVVNTMNTTDTTNTEPLLPGWDPGDATSVTSISGIIKKLLQDTARQAAYNSGNQMFATGRMDVGGNFPELFSMARCVPVLTHRDCSWCLEVISFRAMENFAGKQGGRLLALWCYLRAHQESFDHCPRCFTASIVSLLHHGFLHIHQKAQTRKW